MATINIDIDLDDILWELSSSEKDELCQELIEDGYGPGPEEFNGLELGAVLRAETYTDAELVKLFKDMWSNRHFIDHKMVDELRVNLRERNIL